MPRAIRNVAIIAHVDHGKTTLVDKLLRQSGTLDLRKPVAERVMDSNALERERGITILAKNTAIQWREFRINIVDTPGHADFGGEVERVLSMVDCVLLLVDAVDGPMPQTRFVTQKAFAHGLAPIVVVNKIDRPEARPDWVVSRTFDLFDRLGASEQQLDFPVVYTSALRGVAALAPDALGEDMTALFETIVTRCPAPDVDVDGPLQLQVSQLDYSSYVGSIGIGRIRRGTIRRGMPVAVVDRAGTVRNERVGQVFGFMGLERVEVAGSLAPAVLWIDEIEKGFAAALSDPVASRVFGWFLTWLSEKREPVFVVATANDVQGLPPELLRRGRFDELFFVDLPSPAERAEILRIHLAKRGRDPLHFDIDELSLAAERLTGAELEQVVAAALYTAFAESRDLSEIDLANAIEQTVPLYDTYEERIKELRDWARHRARSATIDPKLVELFTTV